MKRLLDERNELYAEVATVEIPTDGLGVDAVVAEVRRQLADPAEVRT
jgi:shikimate kinase